MIGVISFIAGLVILLLLRCTSLINIVPANYILLVLFTACFSVGIAVMTVVYTPDQVALAAVATALVVVSLTVYSFYTSTDIIWYIALIFVLLIALVPIMIWGLAAGYAGLNVLFCGVYMLIYSIYLIIDTKAMIGSRWGKYEDADAIIGAVDLYIDILMIFWYGLQMFGSD